MLYFWDGAIFEIRCQPNGMVLIVDDNQENIFSLKTLLELHKFRVDFASSGEEALKKILQNSYSLVILDVQMPDMDGFEVAEAMSGYSESRDIPIIFLSAVNTHKKFVARGYASGGTDYVTKPFDPDILLLKVKTFYRLSEQKRQLMALEKSLREEIELRKEAEAVLERRVEERTRELSSSNHRLEESNKELERFAFAASHDLQEPLRKIQIFSEMVLEQYHKDPSRVISYMEKINMSAHRLRGLVSELLSYSQIEASPRFTMSNLNHIIDEVISEFEYKDPDHRPVIHVSPIPEIEIIPTEIWQVFQNLISNSIKFSKKDVPSIITIKAERVSDKTLLSHATEEGEYCRITLSDNGIGFNDRNAGKIFEIFERLNTRNAYEGNGIGLAIVKKVIEKHGGIIAAAGKENEGAIFTIILPLRHEHSSPALHKSIVQ